MTFGVWATDAQKVPVGPAALAEVTRSFTLSTTPAYYAFDLSGDSVGLEAGNSYGLSLSTAIPWGDSNRAVWSSPNPSCEPTSNLGFTYDRNNFTTDSGLNWTEETWCLGAARLTGVERQAAAPLPATALLLLFGIAPLMAHRLRR